MFFGTVRQQFFIEIRDIPLIGLRIFPRSWLGTVRQTFLNENRDTRPLFYPKDFSMPEISEALKESVTKISAQWEKNIRWKLLIVPPSALPFIHKLFLLPEIFWNTA